jgi:hypothetical protein
LSQRRGFQGRKEKHSPRGTVRACNIINMDLANMRSLGITRIDAYCVCGYRATIDVSALPDDQTVPSVGYDCGVRSAALAITRTWHSLRQRVAQPHKLTSERSEKLQVDIGLRAFGWPHCRGMARFIPCNS